MTEYAVPTLRSGARFARAPGISGYLNRWTALRYRCGVAFILVLAIVNCFWHLSSNVISDLDEARYGVAASEMLQHHSALVATYGGRPEFWNLKPPLGYWLQEISFKVFGPTVFALRFPAALCSLAIVALTISFARRWYGRSVALLAGVVLATCFGMISYHGSRSGDLDSVLTLIVLAAMIQVPHLAESAKARVIFGGMFALGFLLKSFAIIPFLFSAICCAVWCQSLQRTKALHWLAPSLLFIGIVVAWMFARCWIDGTTYFVKRMLLEDLVQRSTETIDQEVYKPWGYVAVLMDRFAPWPIFIIVAAVARKEFRALPSSAAARLVLVWALLPLLAFSAARTQHHWYLDPSYPAWSILAAAAVLSLWNGNEQRIRPAQLGLVFVGIVFCESRVLFRVLHTDRRPAAQTFLLSLNQRPHDPTDAIVAAFPLSHSERFILQVVDGFTVGEPDLPSTAVSAGRTLVLARRQQGAAIWARHPEAQVVAAGAGYVLFQTASRDSCCAD